MADVVVSVLTKEVLKKLILNIKYETTPEDKWLIKGDELCRGSRMTPMSSELIKKVRDIYKKCKYRNGDTALMMALKMGLMDMVWGFIECAIQANTNLLNGESGDEHVQNFFWLSNNWNRTAFDIAVERDHVEVARILLNNASDLGLTSQWNTRRKTLLHMINGDPKFDAFVCGMLISEKERKGTPKSTALWIDSQQDQLKIWDKGEERIVTPEFLDNLSNGLLGSNARKNTILHLVSKIGNVACIEYILKKNHSQISCHNSDMETPVYVAAREGRVDTLGYMINFIKQMNEDIEPIVTRSIDKHNALHIAIQNHHLDVIFLLLQEIPQLANRINESKESPLYLAAERRYFGVVNLILRCEEIAFEGPKGKTALHAAAISDSPECVEYLLNKNGNLLNVKDDRGWTPLHLAVYHNSWLATRKLLNVDFSIGYHELILEDGKNTSAIHIAASRGNYETMEVLMDLCPGCSEFIDNEGRNILHVAVEYKKHKIIDFIFQDKSLTDLINQKDKNGNTPIHLLVASNFENMELLMDSRVNINTLNNKKLTPLDMISSNDQRERLIKAMTMGTSCIHDTINKSRLNETKWEVKEKQSEAKGKKTDTRFVIVDSLVVVAALIATATFAAGFTVPGGFDGNDGSKQGTPFLLRKPAFQTFIVTNAIAFSFSCSVLLGHIALVFYRNRYDEASLDEQDYIDGKIEDMYYFTTLALFAMTIAFVTGLYVALTPSLGLAISVCVVTLLIIAINMHKDSFIRSRKAADLNAPSLLGKLLCR